MKLYRVGILIGGRKAYCYSVLSFLCSFNREVSLLMLMDDAHKARNFITYMIPSAETFMEEVIDERLLGSQPKDCPACDAGHCNAHP